MAEQAAKPGNGDSRAPGQGQQVQVRVIAQYIKDLSFENPNVRKLVEIQGEAPNLRIEVNVNAAKVSDNTYESTIQLKAEATSKIGTIYDLELAYAGMFQIENMAEPSLEPFLLINCPSLLFPFARRLAADLTREGGFPPLLLDPIDFAGLFVKRQQERQTQAGQANPAS
jgi:preprotein translocase subunit SecB